MIINGQNILHFILACHPNPIQREGIFNITDDFLSEK